MKEVIAGLPSAAGVYFFYDEPVYINCHMKLIKAVS